MTQLHLPFPPSANRLWRNVPGKGTLKSREYREWLERAANWLVGQRYAEFPGAYRLRIVATPPDRRGRDIDNLIKPVSDLLKMAGIVADDKYARFVSAEWSDSPPAKPGQVIVTLEDA